MLHALPRSDLASATVGIVFGTRHTPSPLATAQIYAGAASRGRDMPWSRQQLEGGRLFTLSHPDFVAIGITALSSVMEAVLAQLLPAIVGSPLWVFDIQSAMENRVAALADREPQRRAFATVLGGLFPSPHPYGLVGAAALGERVREVKVTDVRAFRDANLTTDNVVVVATGNVDLRTLTTTLDRALANIPPAPSSVPTNPSALPATCASGVVALNDDGSQQTTLSVAYPAVPATHADVPALEVLAAALGGSISTHLNVSLRQGRGLTYGFQAELHKMRDGGLLSIEGPVDPASTLDALRGLEEEIDALRRKPLGDDELRVAKISAAHSTSHARGAGSAFRLARAAILHTPIAEGPATVAVTAEQVRAAAERYLAPAKRCVVAVGDAERIEFLLRSAGFGPVSR
jgi:zinc protease